jgi:XapX domain-containing protein
MTALLSERPVRRAATVRHKDDLKIIAGLLLGFLIGVGCRFFDVPVPSLPKLVGALLVVAMALGYLATDMFLARNVRLFGERLGTTPKYCGGSTG